MRLSSALFFFSAIPASAFADPIADLARWIALDRSERPAIAEQDFAKQSLDKGQAIKAEQLLRDDRIEWIKEARAGEVKAQEVRLGDKTMRYEMRSYGKKSGRSLFLSLHGGGGGPAQMNNQQWKNQLVLYRPREGIYLAPRAPTNTWDLWHQEHIDGLFDRLIENLVVFEDVNPDRVYVMGYSAGGDGVYQLAPRMSDRFAGAAMMAGHPNETSPVGLRNVPFALQVGENDSSYNRNKVASEWGKKLAELQKNDPGGYVHLFELHKGKAHWMDLDDKQALPWMAKFDRHRYPERVVWKQDDVTHSRFYWLSLPKDEIEARQLIIAKRDAQTITIEQAERTGAVTILLNDEMLDLDQPLTIVADGSSVFEGKADRRIAEIAATLEERGLPGLVFSAKMTVKQN